jgi:hypothetical protein
VFLGGDKWAKCGGILSATEDLRPKWANAARRQQSVACKTAGYAVITFKVLVAPDGNPAFWMEPTIDKIEPQTSSAGFLAAIIGKIDTERQAG